MLDEASHMQNDILNYFYSDEFNELLSNKKQFINACNIVHISATPSINQTEHILKKNSSKEDKKAKAQEYENIKVGQLNPQTLSNNDLYNDTTTLPASDLSKKIIANVGHVINVNDDVQQVRMLYELPHLSSEVAQLTLNPILNPELFLKYLNKLPNVIEEFHFILPDLPDSIKDKLDTQNDQPLQSIFTFLRKTVNGIYKQKIIKHQKKI